MTSDDQFPELPALNQPERRWWVVPLVAAILLFLAGIGVGRYLDQPSPPPVRTEEAATPVGEPPPESPAPAAKVDVVVSSTTSSVPVDAAKSEVKPPAETVTPPSEAVVPAPEPSSKTVPVEEAPPRNEIGAQTHGEPEEELPVEYEEPPTHEPPPPPIPLPTRPPSGKGTARVAIIIDDIGYTPTSLAIAKLPYAITLAILPGGELSRQSATIGQATHKEVILHQPMEPKGYPKVKPGPGAMFSNMESEQIRQILLQNLKQFPEAVGINNHMGSRLTENRDAMDTVMETLRGKSMFFVDSRTSQSSVAYARALAHGLSATRRDVFLDNIPKAGPIDARLAELEHIAHHTGRAVGIGHPYRETLHALQRWLPEATKRGIQVEPISHFLRVEPKRQAEQPSAARKPVAESEKPVAKSPAPPRKPPLAPVMREKPAASAPPVVQPAPMQQPAPTPAVNLPVLDPFEHVLPVDPKP
ncbi:MAG: divergent polysaccharide deacetylase family protein [Magnetococcales bacterium]|nr:divergent polysaccharide deacetylase family protein [Magnetococcales bacterium]